MPEVTATIVVNFDAAGGGSLSAELDSRPEGFNSGRTTFGSGDEPAILVFASSDVSIDSVVPSAGTGVIGLGGGIMEVSEDLQFQDKAEASLSRPFYNGFTYKWLGNNLNTPIAKENNVIIPAKGVGILRVTYNTFFFAYRVMGVPYPLNGEVTFPVLIVVTGTKG